MEIPNIKCRQHNIKCEYICLSIECNQTTNSNRLICQDCLILDVHKFHNAETIESSLNRIKNIKNFALPKIKDFYDLTDIKSMLLNNVKERQLQIQEFFLSLEQRINRQTQIPEKSKLQFLQLEQTLEAFCDPTILLSNKVSDQNLLIKMINQNSFVFDDFFRELQRRKQEISDYANEFISIDLKYSIQVMKNYLNFSIPDFNQEFSQLECLLNDSAVTLESGTCFYHENPTSVMCIEPECRQSQPEICKACIIAQKHVNCQQMHLKEASSKLNALVAKLKGEIFGIVSYQQEQQEIKQKYLEIQIDMHNLVSQMEENLLKVIQDLPCDRAQILKIENFVDDVLKSKNILRSASPQTSRVLARKFLKSENLECQEIIESFDKIREAKRNQQTTLTQIQTNFIQKQLSILKEFLNQEHNLNEENASALLKIEHENKQSVNRIIKNIIQLSNIKMVFSQQEFIEQIAWNMFQEDGISFFENFAQIFDQTQKFGPSNNMKIIGETLPLHGQEIFSQDQYRFTEKIFYDMISSQIQNHQCQKHFPEDWAEGNNSILYQLTANVFQVGPKCLEMVHDYLDFIFSIFQPPNQSIIQQMVSAKQNDPNYKIYNQSLVQHLDIQYCMLKQSEFFHNYDTKSYNSYISKIIQFDDKRILAVDQDNNLNLINLREKQIEQTLKVNSEIRFHCIITIDKNLIAVNTYDGQIKIFDFDKAELTIQLEGNSDSCNQAILFSEKYNYLIYSYNSGNRCFGFYKKDGDNFKKLEQTFDKYHTGEILKLISVDEDLIASCGMDKKIQIWNLKSLKEEKQFSQENHVSDIHMLGQNSIVSACMSGHFSIWDLTNNSRIQVEVGGTDYFYLEIISEDYIIIAHHQISPSIQIRSRFDEWQISEEFQAKELKDQKFFSCFLFDNENLILYHSNNSNRHGISHFKSEQFKQNLEKFIETFIN